MRAAHGTCYKDDVNQLCRKQVAAAAAHEAVSEDPGAAAVGPARAVCVLRQHGTRSSLLFGELRLEHCTTEASIAAALGIVAVLETTVQ